jgi:hypothetical protein
MRGWVAALGVSLGLSACTAPPRAELDWNVEARLTSGQVKVLPVMSWADEPVVRLDSYLDAGIGLAREERRRERTEELKRVPDAVALAVPGAVRAKVGDAWSTHLLPGRWPPGTRDRVAGALRRGGRDVDDVLGGVARNMDADAVLMTWVSSIEGAPLTSEALPGEIVRTSAGPVLVDFGDEAYRVKAAVGMAYVASDGEVVIRYADDFEAVLSKHRDPASVGRQVAMALADEVAKVWPVDERLG